MVSGLSLYTELDINQQFRKHMVDVFPVEAEPQLAEGQKMQLEKGNEFSCQSLPYLCLQVNTLNF